MQAKIPPLSGPEANVPKHMRSRMAAQDTHENTEEIIDLTELIEKGAIPEADSAASGPTASEEDELHSHMRSLNDGGQNIAAEAEIDDLLAQMEYKEGDADAAASSAPKADAGDGSAESGMAQADSDATTPSDFSPVRMPDGHIVDPHEELHMPGIGDVDSLLNSLDIPPQPRPHEKAAPSPEDTDNAVDQMLGSLNGASRPAAENPPKDAATAPHDDMSDLDELLAAGTMPEPVISDELEALLRESAQSANQPQSTGKNQATPPASEPAAGQAQAPSAAGPAQNDPSHDLNADLDALLQSIMTDKPQQDANQPLQVPSDTAQASAPAHDAGHDAALHAPQGASPNASPDVSPDADKNVQQDAAPNADQNAPQSQPAPASPSGANANAHSADPDPSLSSGKQADDNRPDPGPMADSAASQPTDASPVASDQAKTNDKLEFDLDALLAAADAEERDVARHVATPAASAAEQQPDPAHAAEQPGPDQAAQTAAQSDQAAKPQQSDSKLPDVDLDDILGGNIVTAPPAQTATADQAATSTAQAATSTAKAASDAAGQGATPDLTEILARLDLYAEKLQQADDRAQALEAAVAEARAEADQARADAEQARAEAEEVKTATQQIQSDLGEKLTATQASHESLAQTAAEALHTAQNAAQAAASATAQQQEQPDATPSLEDLFDPAHPLHQRLMDSINAAAAEAASKAARQAAEEAVAAAQSPTPKPHDAPAGHEDPALLESLLDDRMHAVNLTMRGASARLDAVEGRLDELEPRFNDRVEKAAASAAARILREEIGRLLENE